MRKAIHIDQGLGVVRVLSVADVSILEGNPTGLTYFAIEDYENPPMLVDVALDKVYPMYDTRNGRFFWQVIHYQSTATEEILKIVNLENELQKLKEENSGLKEVVDSLLLESLLGGDGNV